MSQVQKIGTALAFNTVLQSLNLSGLISVGPAGARTIAAALKENRTLSRLNLDNANVGDEGAIAIADMLRTNRTLTDLALGGNGIRAQGAVALAAALERNTSIVKINLAHNQIGADSDVCTEAAVGALATAIEKNKTIKVILMNRNSICHEFRSTLIAACQKNNASGGVIEYFSVGDTRWTNAPATAISVAPVEVTQAWEVDPDLELEGSTAAEPFLSKAPY